MNSTIVGCTAAVVLQLTPIKTTDNVIIITVDIKKNFFIITPCFPIFLF
jgi:hypothetical protein